ncbi:MAG: hypothetical protein K9M45_13860 [Kiritimatiellales bacterium]|nr:hypothetical protein [Kiritimatiellales bacterium]
MSDAVNRITFNGESEGRFDAAAWIAALNDPRIVTEKSGFLFKASLDGDHLRLAVAPCLINGERSYHYNMQMEGEDAFTLIGAINAQGIFTILFKAESRELSVKQIARYVDTFRRFAAFMRNAGYAGEGRLDEVTQAVLKRLGLSPVPQYLGSL